ncbi:MAG: hypothetical protein Q8L68_00915 [Methylococcales bacterium]|nr:hypothetical protein [Methylococcales bacterium]
MNRKLSAKIASVLLILHGIMEVAGLFALNSPNQTAQTMENFGGMGKEQIAANMVSIVLLGALWGVTRFIAAWGIWSMKKWAISLGCVLSIISLIASISIIPFGVVDTLLGAPALILLLYTWFGNEKIEMK